MSKKKKMVETGENSLEKRISALETMIAKLMSKMEQWECTRDKQYRGIISTLESVVCELDEGKLPIVQKKECESKESDGDNEKSSNVEVETHRKVAENRAEITLETMEKMEEEELTKPELMLFKRFGLDKVKTENWKESAPRFPKPENNDEKDISKYLRIRLQEAILAKYSRLSFANRLVEAYQDFGSYPDMFEDPYTTCVKILAGSDDGQFRQQPDMSTHTYLAECLEACYGQKPSIIREIAEGALDAGWASWILYHLDEISKKPMWFTALKAKSNDWNLMTDAEQAKWICTNDPSAWIPASQYWVQCKNSKNLHRRPKEASVKVFQREQEMKESHGASRDRRVEKAAPKQSWSKENVEAKRTNPTGGDKAQSPGAANRKPPFDAAARRVDAKMANTEGAHAENMHLIYARIEMPEGVKVKALVDTGCTQSLIRSDVLPESLLKKIRPAQLIVRGINPLDSFQVKGMVSIPVKFENGSEEIIEFVVMDSLTEQVLLGMDLIGREQCSLRRIDGELALVIDEMPEADLTRGIEEEIALAFRACVENQDNKYVSIVSDQLDEKSRSEIVDLIKSYNDVIVEDLEVGGAARVRPMKIDTGDAAPVSVPPRRIHIAKREPLYKEINRLLELGCIEPTISPWGSPAHLILKSDGKEWRFCVDYRRLNAVTKHDSFPMPRVDEMLDLLGGHSYFSVLDAASGYHQIPLEEESGQKATVVTPENAYKWNVVSFGLTGAPAHFQRVMSEVLTGQLNKHVMCYIDDIIVFSKTWEEHLLHLQEVLEALRRVNLRVKRRKCQIGMKEVSYLGHIVNGDGVKMNEELIKDIVRCEEPRNVKELQCFLGLSGYYRRFVKDYAMIARPLHDLLKKGAQWKFNEEERDAFERLKLSLISQPTLAHPNFKKPWMVNVDASGVGYGASLLQKNDEDIPQPIGFFSRAFSASQRKWSATEREAYAVVEALRHWYPYLVRENVTVYTDHQPLVSIFKSGECTDDMIARWIRKVQNLRLTVQYKPGGKHLDADALSRPPIVKVNRATVEFIPNTSILMEIDGQRHTLKEWQRKDEWCSRILEAKVGNGATSSEIQGYIKKISISNDILMYQKALNEPKRVVVPKVMRRIILQEFHDSLMSGGHLGLKKVYGKICRRFWWPRCKRDVAEYIKECPECALVRDRRSPKALIRPLEPVTKLFERVGIDMIGKLPKTVSGNEYALVLVDHYTHWPEVFPVKDQTASTVANIIVNEIFPRYGFPKSLVSDQGTNFMSELSTELYNIMNTKKLTTTAYHPQTNGMVERFNGTLKRMLERYARYNPERWDEFIPYLLFAYRSAPHSSTKISPFELMYGTQPNEGMDVLRDLDVIDDSTMGTHFISSLHRRLVRNRKEAKRLAAESERVEREARTKTANRKRREKNFAVGDRVFLLEPEVTIQPIFKDKKSGPWIIIKEGKTKLNFTIQLGLVTKTVHVDRLEPYVPRREIVRAEFLSEQLATMELAPAKGEKLDSDVGVFDLEERSKLFDQVPKAYRKAIGRLIVTLEEIFYQVPSTEEELIMRMNGCANALKQLLDTRKRSLQEWLVEYAILREEKVAFEKKLEIMKQFLLHAIRNFKVVFLKHSLENEELKDVEHLSPRGE